VCSSDLKALMNVRQRGWNSQSFGTMHAGKLEIRLEVFDFPKLRDW
jgi:hypothetical protein